MEIQLLFCGAKKSKTVWKKSVGMLYTFGRRQFLSSELPEMPLGWLTRVTGDSVLDSWGAPGQEPQLWGQRIWLCFQISSSGEKLNSTDVILMVAMWWREVPIEVQSGCETPRGSSELQGWFSWFHLHFCPSWVDTEMSFSPSVLVPFCGFCPSFARVLPFISPVSTIAPC